MRPILLAIAAFFLLGGNLLAADAPVKAPSMEDRVAALEKTAGDPHTANDAVKMNNGDNAWMLVSTLLVLMMTIPGLALFYGGLVRRKNVLATMMQSFSLMCVVTVLWAVIGYSLAFNVGTPFIGGFDFPGWGGWGYPYDYGYYPYDYYGYGYGGYPYGYGGYPYGNYGYSRYGYYNGPGYGHSRYGYHNRAGYGHQHGSRSGHSQNLRRR